MKCPWCGAESEEKVQFCPTCGEWTGEMAGTAALDAKQPEAKPERIALRTQATGEEPPKRDEVAAQPTEILASVPTDGSVTDFAAKFLGREFAGCKVQKHLSDTPAYSEFLCIPPSGIGEAVLRIVTPTASKNMQMQRLIKESKAVRHSNAVRAIESGEFKGYYYVLIEHVEGRAIAQMIREGKRFSWQEALKLLKGTLPVLKSAHEMGIIHRGISPWRVIIDRKGEARIRDFGFAGLTGPTAGSPLSPEQVTGKGIIDARCDIYSLGIVAYAAMTGRIPNVTSTREQQHVHEIQPLYSIVPDVPGPLEAIINKMTASDVSQRYQNASEALDDIGKMDLKMTAAPGEAHRVSSGGATKRPTAILMAQKKTDKSPIGKIITMAIVLVALGAAAAYFLTMGKENKAAQTNTGKTASAPAPKPKEIPPKFTNPAGMEFILVSPGSFMMGSKDSEPERKWDEGPVHNVTISRPYYLQAAEVTQGEWKKVKGEAPMCRFQGDGLPVDNVSWFDAVDFIKTLSVLDNRIYRLPTEAEWEYACRAGTSAEWSFGDNEPELADYAWYINNSYGDGESGRTFPVGGKKPNPWGFYDIHGNVWEWCSDWYSPDYYGTGPSTDPKGPPDGKERVWRGGCWGSTASFCRSARRNSLKPDLYNSYVGFRLVAEP